MYVEGLWRYPVKSLAGETLSEARLTSDGVAGDRTVHVRGRRGPLTGRTRHELLTIPATTGPGGVPWIAGHAWNTAAAADIIRSAAGPDAELAAYTGPERFERPNLLVGGVPGLAEQDWPGHALVIGEAVIGLHSNRGRCIVTTIDPDTGDQDLDVFRRIRNEFGGELCLNAWVIKPGVVRIGDPVTLERTRIRPDHVGGWIVGAPYVAPRSA